MRLRYFAAAYLSVAISGIDVGTAAAQDVVKIGVVIPMTGGLASVGREVAAGAKLYIQQYGETVAGRKVELIIRDDAGVPDTGKRLAQELIVKDKVSFLGAGTTPTAMAMAPLATEAKVATAVMVSGTSVVTERSPTTCGQALHLASNPGSSLTGRPRTGAKKRSPSSAIGRRVPRPAKSLTNISPRVAAKSSIL